MQIPASSLGPRGPEVTRLGLGGEGVLRTFGRESEAREVIDAAWESGIRYMETARAYSGSERYYGRALPGRRGRVFLASKAHDRSYHGAMAMLETTLRELRTDYLDLWQLHDVREWSDLSDWEHPGGTYDAFADAKKQGKVRHIGVTGHHDPAVLRAALERFPFDTVLLPVNPAEGCKPDSFEAAVVPAARKAGMGVVGMKVFARGLLVHARGGGLSASEALTYALSGDVDVVVIGCDDAGQVRRNAAAVAAFQRYSAAERGNLERRVRSAADSLAYYRRPELV